ncbi:DUF5105 domain-containing protein [Enterococcus sp. BWB1-3]|uniref:DUF5105 domain-containing protein n=1 Tax=unclassified Enterococcus TaxID=2608891 RepID=UPI001920C996|nr:MULTISPECIES: DUF5105 domain-containing protein [unclassified Enterococcus]MBL1228638.1 DUF5105 domain-containing protein [Enterococcus sp. BWB1-3]MCB5953625.1 DUF5105 domain-containing protein [Enterococcus sp. CWB-B31]
MRKAMVILLVVVGIFLTGCNKAIPAEEAGELLIDRLIYQERVDEFASAFRDGEQSGRKLDAVSDDFEDNFISGLSATGASVPEAEAGELTQELLNQMRNKTSYKIVGIDETKNGATISYFITGLDLVNAMKEMTRTLVKDSIENAEKELTDQEILESTITILTERIKVIKIENETIELSIKLEKENGKWFIPTDQEEAVSNLFMAFISGTQDDEELDEALNEVVDEVMNEMLDSLYSQPALDENLTDDELQQAVDDLLNDIEGSSTEQNTSDSE